MFTAIVTIAAVYWTWLFALNKNADVANDRLTLYRGTLENALDKYRYLPFVVANDQRVKELFTKERQSRDVNQYLQSLKNESNVDVVYILNRSGLTIAASNWDAPKSFLGQRYEFRPYFIEAINGRKGEFFAIGYTTGIPGYFFSSPIYDKGQIIGVSVVKVDLAPLQEQWRRGGETVLVTDEYGVVVLSSSDKWLYRTLGLVPPKAIEKIRQERRYRGNKLRILTKKNIAKEVKSFATIDRKGYYTNSKKLSALKWKIFYLTSEGEINERLLTTGIFTGTCGVLIMLLALLLKQRRLQEQSKIQAEEALRFKVINETLALEIEERKRAEEELRSVHEELIQAGKLTALGQMAAAMAHELNQPITAMKMSMYNARKLIANSRVDDVLGVLVDIDGLTDRMRKITEQLKAFARKKPLSLTQFDVNNVIDESLRLVSPQIKTNDCHINFTKSSFPLIVEADPGRLEQVLINLIRNSIDAMRDQEIRILSFRLIEYHDNISIHVQDTGKGISKENINQIFEPFFTTKKAGKGVGLGLAISNRIIEGFGGKLSVQSTLGEGALFEINLPRPQTLAIAANEN